MKQTEIRKIIESIEDSDYFRQAFIHNSYRNENNLKISYETLEFLGDSVINFYTSLFIYKKFPNFSEGQMSKLKQLMVQESTLAHLSKKIGLGEYLKLGKGERKNQGIDKNSILADIFESFSAVLYLEKSGRIVYKFLKLTLFTWVEGKENIIWDYKSQLQEYCQAQKNKLYYCLKGEKRMGSQQLFTIEVRDELGTFQEIGRGKSKKDAEQKAAAEVIKKLGIKEEQKKEKEQKLEKK